MSFIESYIYDLTLIDVELLYHRLLSAFDICSRQIDLVDNGYDCQVLKENSQCILLLTASKAL